MDHVFALIDCENFYVSCERVFDPSLRGTPVAVLSNNDGCVIARSEEVKEAGVPMGAPLFKWREELDEIGTEILSSNYTLYGDMSRRVHSIIEEEALALERYSIDEAFAALPELSRENLPGWPTGSGGELGVMLAFPSASGSGRRRLWPRSPI
ncbi:nucleotidyltransferase/DNA polymerase involved in DNA repair [Salinibacter ruber]|nr:nucleotidyltransferase/DNA polymerase involved in DNA repair [Salinibacter ruber]